MVIRPRIAIFLSLGLVGTCVVTPSVAEAHDSWLISDTSSANDGDLVWLSFVIGEDFPLGDKVTDAAQVAQFIDRVDGQTTDVTGYMPQDTGLSVRRPFAGPGLHVIGCALLPQFLKMNSGDLEKRPRAEQAHSALAALGPQGDINAASIVEECMTFAKTIIEVSPADDDESFAQPLGHRLEIVPLSNPCRWKAGQTARVKVLFDGYPWPDVIIALGGDDRNAHDDAALGRTDAKGCAAIPLSRAGHSFIMAQLRRPTDGLGKVKWESFSASLTFRIGVRVEVNRSLQAIRAFHGRLDPGAVAGFRIGRRALAELGLTAGADDLVAVQRAARLPQLTSMLDGIQAATGATFGRLNLRWEESAAKTMESVFSNRATGQSVAFHLSPECLESVQAGGEDMEARAMKLATMADNELFEVSVGRDELRMANGE